ncbi:MAG: DUF3187 family protein [Planctomycetes bacterium]|nr:DUF3187 family protein [Planctomycetota bacterium]
MPRSPRRLALAAALLCASCSALRHAEHPAAVVRGPLATRQQQPMALTLFAFRPRRAVTQPAGELAAGVQLAWSSIEEIRRYPVYAPTESVVMDGETIRTTLRARYGLGAHTDVEVELPFLHAGAGGLDHFIEAWHRVFGLPGGGRERFPDDQYEMRVVEGGDVLYELEGNRLALQDVPVILTRNVRREDAHGPAIALRGALELPTGSESSGFGNGALDVGVGVLGERSLGRWSVFGALSVLAHGQPDRLRALPAHELEDQLSIELSGEYRWNDRLSLLLGTVWTSRMISTVRVVEISREVIDLGGGASWDLDGGGRVTLSVHEDLVAQTGSDLTLQLGAGWGF